MHAVYGSNGVVGWHSRALTSGPTVIIGRKGSFGEVAYSTEACWPIDTAYYVDSTSSQVDLKWLSYRLGGLGLKKLNKSAAVPGLNRDDAYRQSLLLPPIEEQRRIAAILDRADALRAKRRQVLAQLDLLQQSIFVRLFGEPSTWFDRWTLGSIGDLVESTQYGTSTKAGAVGEWPVLRMGNVTDAGRLNLDDLKYLDLLAPQSPKYTVRRGDLLFNRTNSPEKVGKCCVVETDRPLAFAGYLVRVRFTNPASAYFVSAYLTSRHGRAVRRGRAKAAVNQANINPTELKSISIAHPPKELIDAFAMQVKSIGQHRTLIERDLTVAEDLFAALQSRAFRGEL